MQYNTCRRYFSLPASAVYAMHLAWQQNGWDATVLAAALLSSPVAAISCTELLINLTRTACCSAAGCSSSQVPQVDPVAIWACKVPAAHGFNCSSDCNTTALVLDPPTVTCNFGGQSACDWPVALQHPSSTTLALQPVHRMHHLQLVHDTSVAVLQACAVSC